MRRCWKVVVLPMVFVAGAMAEENSDVLMQRSDLLATVKNRSEAALVEESIAVEQARASAQSRSEYGLELRPRVTDSDVGAALRIYLPSRWNKSKLREQLVLVAQEEQLRVAALEWQDLMNVYRGFCEFRMLNKQREIYQEELSTLEPYLEKANVAVELNQLTVTDRAKLYSLYLDLVNSQEKVSADLLKNQQKLHLLVGPEAHLEAMAATAQMPLPAKAEFEPLFQQALTNRPDFQLHSAHARSTSAAEAVARSEDGFRLKYIQPDIQYDYNDGDMTYGLSASFILPWGTRNPDLAVYQQQQALSRSVMDLQRRLIADRLKVLLKTADEYAVQDAARSDRIKPLLAKLEADLKIMDTGRLEELRDVMLVRERMLDVSLQTTRANYTKEQIAIDLAEEIGTLAQ